uniref:trans-2,3-enoyl-CoA reductase-like isoform X3 n=1 Tax=Pristiophorus japonicus TaxID=55135 RepID=UPI00398EFD32
MLDNCLLLTICSGAVKLSRKRMHALHKGRAAVEEAMLPGKQSEPKSFLSLSQFLLTSGQVGQCAIQKHSKISYVEVEILDAHTKKQICVLEKILPSFTIADVKHKFHKACPQWYPSRVGLQLECSGPLLKESKVIKTLAVSSIITLYFRDLGTQISWTTGCAFYWGFTTWMAYYINHPLYTPPSFGNRQIVPAMFCFLVCGAGNYFTNCVLVQVHKTSTKTHFVRPTYNPFTWLFKLVSCPNYTYEMGVWISFTVMTQTLPVAVFALMVSLQLIIWAQRKHCKYQKDLKNYPSYRTAMIPFIL